MGFSAMLADEYLLIVPFDYHLWSGLNEQSLATKSIFIFSNFTPLRFRANESRTISTAESPERWQQYIDTMKVRPELLVLFLLVSCIYDPPLKGKTVFIHNQTGHPLFVIDSLTGNYLKLYDTAKVNDRRYISRRPNFMTEYGVFERFYSDNEIDSIQHKRNNRLTFYFIGQEFLQNTPSTVLTNHSFRSFEISIDTLKKYELNHLFVTKDTVLLEHHHDFYTEWKQ